MPATVLLRDLSTRNPNHQIARSARAALKNAVFLFNCVTFGTSTEMTDLSGNGYHATWDAAPTTTSLGVTCDGSRYADCPAGTAGLFDNITGFFVQRHTGAGNSRFTMAQLNHAGNTGIGLYTTAGWVPRMRLGAPSNDSTAEGSQSGHANTATNAWRLVIWKVKDGMGLVSCPIAGTTMVTRTWSTSNTLAKAWRIAAAYTTADAPFSIQNAATLGYCGLIDGVTNAAQDAAIVQYMRDVMTGRGAVLT